VVWDLLQYLVKPAATVVLGLAILDARFAPAAPVTATLSGFALRADLVPLPQLSGWHLPALGWFELGLAIAVSLLVHLVRSATDLVAWLSPFPFVDALVSGLADIYAVAMIATALLFPRVAVVLGALQLVACLLAARAMLRVTWAFVRRALRGIWPAPDRGPGGPWPPT